MFRRSTLLVVALVLSGVAAATRANDTNGDGRETILLPLAFGGVVSDTIPGAFGTRWRGELWIHNGNRTSVTLMDGLSICPTIDCFTSYSAGFTGRVAEIGWVHPDRGILLYPAADIAKQITLSNRLLEVTRHAQPQGFEIPVVREGEFLAGPSLFLGIPGGSAVRSALRIYDPRRVFPATSLEVEVLDRNNAVVAQTSLTMQLEDSITQPGYAAILDLAAVFPITTAMDRYQIRVTPNTGAQEYWAMVSVTDNDTQQVLVITAQ